MPITIKSVYKALRLLKPSETLILCYDIVPTRCAADVNLVCAREFFQLNARIIATAYLALICSYSAARKDDSGVHKDSFTLVRLPKENLGSSPAVVGTFFI